MNDADLTQQITGKKPRALQCQALAQLTNDQLVRLVAHCGSMADQWRMLCALERLYRKANKDRRFSIGRLQGLVEAIRPRGRYGKNATT